MRTFRTYCVFFAIGKFRNSFYFRFRPERKIHFTPRRGTNLDAPRRQFTETPGHYRLMAKLFPQRGNNVFIGASSSPPPAKTSLRREVSLLPSYSTLAGVYSKSWRYRSLNGLRSGGPKTGDNFQIFAQFRKFDPSPAAVGATQTTNLGAV